MTRFVIRVDPTRVELNTFSGRLLGPISVAIDGYDFPEAGWTDFVGLTLVAWTDEVSKLDADPLYLAKCYFHDGPFRFELEDEGGGLWKLVGYQETQANPNLLLVEAVVAKQDLVEQLSAAVRAISDVCARTWTESFDHEHLIEARRSLGIGDLQ